jgi:hypothetical protein
MNEPIHLIKFEDVALDIAVGEAIGVATGVSIGVLPFPEHPSPETVATISSRGSVDDGTPRKVAMIPSSIVPLHSCEIFIRGRILSIFVRELQTVSNQSNF